MSRLDAAREFAYAPYSKFRQVTDSPVSSALWADTTPDFHSHELSCTV